MGVGGFGRIWGWGFGGMWGDMGPGRSGNVGGHGAGDFGGSQGMWGDMRPGGSQGIWEDMGMGIWEHLRGCGGTWGWGCGGISGDVGGSRLDVHVLVHGVVQEEAESIFPDGGRRVVDHLGSVGLDPRWLAGPLLPNSTSAGPHQHGWALPQPPQPTLLSRVTSCTEICTMGLGSLPGFFICTEMGGSWGAPHTSLTPQRGELAALAPPDPHSQAAPQPGPGTRPGWRLMGDRVWPRSSGSSPKPGGCTRGGWLGQTAPSTTP